MEVHLEGKFMSFAVKQAANLGIVAVAVVMLQRNALAQGDQELMNRVYNDFKQVEALFPIPAFPATINMGTFDGATGHFDGDLVTMVIPPIPGDRPLPGEPRVGPVIKPFPGGRRVPAIEVNAAVVKLQFTFKNVQGKALVTANEKTVNVTSNQDSATVNVGFAKHVEWTVRSGSKSYSDELNIKRPSGVIGAGAFTIPVLPITVVYEPPQEPGVKATVKYSRTEWLGSSISASFASGETNTSADFDALTPFAGKAKDLFKAASELPQLKGIGSSIGPYFMVATAALDLLLSATSDTRNSLTSGETVTKGHKLDTSKLVATVLETKEAKGPGIGDLIVYFKNVRLVWICDKGDLRLALLGAEALRYYPVKLLKEDLDGIDSGGSGAVSHGAVTHLDSGTIRSLLSLDPFVVGGPGTVLPQDRFQRLYGLGGAGATLSQTISERVEQTGVEVKSNFRTEVQDTRPGWLSLFGIGEDREEVSTVTWTHSSSIEGRSGQLIEATLQVTPDTPDTPYYLDIYYDRIFGALAFKEPPPSLEIVSGVVKDADGRPLSGVGVTATIGDQKLATYKTDSQGRYSIRVPDLKDGPLTLTIGTFRKELDYRGAAIRGVDFKF